MSNKYIEKIASFKGFRANRLGLREATLSNGKTRSQHADLLKRMRSRAKEVGNVEMEPGFMAEAVEMDATTRYNPNTKRTQKQLELREAIRNQARGYLEKKYPKGMNSMYRMEL